MHTFSSAARLVKRLIGMTIAQLRRSHARTVKHVAGIQQEILQDLVSEQSEVREELEADMLTPACCALRSHIGTRAQSTNHITQHILLTSEPTRHSCMHLPCIRS